VDGILVLGNDPRSPEACRLLAALSDRPLLAVVDADSVDQRQVVALLDAGADRVLHWPCSLRELEARVGAALRGRLPEDPQGDCGVAYATPEAGLRRRHGTR
jgi:DNA-binding response OmpR family regulator